MTAVRETAARTAADVALVEGIGLSKSFRGRRVVDDVSVSLRQGEIVGLLGPNGAGKTTTFYLMVGLIRAESGFVPAHALKNARTSLSTPLGVSIASESPRSS